MSASNNSLTFFDNKKYLEKKKIDAYYPIWYRLDNAAIVFTLVTSSRIPCIFRVSTTLTSPVKVSLLQIALENIMPRFPYYDVHLRNGFFWNYWEANPERPIVTKESHYPFQKLSITKKGTFPFQIKAYYNRIAIEFHHSLTDGAGAITFLKALIAEYLSLQGIKAVDYGDIFRPNQIPNQEEFEDAFKKNYNKSIPNPNRIERAYHLSYPLEPIGIHHIITGIMPINEILQKAKEKSVSLTEYFVAIYLSALQDIAFEIIPDKESKKIKPIRLMVPVNLRNIYPSKTMRNFSLYVTPGINPRLGKYDFDEILKQVYHYMRSEVTEKFINQQIARNVRGQKNPLVRYSPLFFKKLFGLAIYNGMGEFLVSGVLTNLGRITLPKDLEKNVADIQVYPALSPVIKTGCAVSSYGDNLYINFGRNIKETTVEKLFFRKIAAEGIPVKIETN